MLASKVSVLHPSLVPLSEESETRKSSVSGGKSKCKSPHRRSVRHFSEISFSDSAIARSKSLTTKHHKCIDPKFLLSNSTTLRYDGETYIDTDRSSAVASLRRASLFKKDYATMKNGRGQIITKLFAKPNSNKVYVFRNVPAFRGQQPVSPKIIGTMSKTNITNLFANKRLYKFAKVEYIGNGRTKYCVVVGQNRKGAAAYRMMYGAAITSRGEIVVRDAQAYNVVAKIAFDKYGAVATFHIEKGVDLAAIISIEQAIYVNVSL